MNDDQERAPCVTAATARFSRVGRLFGPLGVAACLLSSWHDGDCGDWRSGRRAVPHLCREAGWQLGLECTGTTDTGCALLAQMQLTPSIAASATTIDEATFTILWTANGCLSGGCRDICEVRVDRVP
jgi:hypothetical protein